MTWLFAAVMIAAAVSGTVGCRPAGTAAPPPRVVRLALGVSSAPGSLVERLAKEYKRLDAGLQIELVGPTLDVIAALERGEADVTLAGAEVLYSSLLHAHGGSAPSGRTTPAATTPLRAIAVLDVATVHLLVPNDSPVHRMADLRGRRLGMSVLAMLRPDPLLAEFGVAGVERYSAPTPKEPVRWLQELNVDAVWQASFAPRNRIADMLRAGARLVPIDEEAAARLRKHYPFMRPIVIPAHTYPGQDSDIQTVGTQTLYVCRSGLDETVVHDLTKYLFQALPRIAIDYPNFRNLDIIHASATPIPLHSGAARYYRDVELFRDSS